MNPKHGIISLLALLLMPFAVMAGPSSRHSQPLSTQQARDSVAKEIYARLAEVTSPADSLPHLLNLFDLSDRRRQQDISRMLYTTAMNAGREDIALYSLRVRANLSVSDDSVLNMLLNTARRMPDSSDKRETVAFINICIARHANNSYDGIQRVRAVSETISRFKNNPPSDIYQEIELLNEIAIYLVNSASFDHINRYLERALQLVDSIEQTSDALRNSILTSMATLNVRNLDPRVTIRSNKALLQLVDSLEHRYRESGRIYKQYNRVRFTSLRRLLSKYNYLTENEVDSIYKEIEALAECDAEISNSMLTQPSPKGYMLMKKGRYGEALSLLRKCFSKDNDSYLNLIYLPAIIEAAEKSGNKAALLEFYPHYIKLLKEYIKIQNEGKFQELETLYNYNYLKSENDRLRDTGRSDRRGYHRTLVTLTIIIVPLLVLLIILLSVLFSRSRRMSRRLAESNERLTAETGNLMVAKQELIVARDKARQADLHKTEFINNMSHEIITPLDAVAEYSQLIVDCVDETKKKYLQKFADVIRLNVDLVSTLVNDILDIGRLESPKFKLNVRPYSLRQIIETSTGAVAHILKPDVKLVVTDKIEKGDRLLITDNHRVEQVLINLLHNAAKFTDEGSVKLDYAFNADGSVITFSVTDTGVGVPKAKASKIFERFEKADPSTVGSGLGLSICAVIARLLKGRVWLDETYTEGARFYFSFPVK